MSDQKVPIIYLLGAGRSGTTLLATALNCHPKVHSLGEMHQFWDHLAEGKPCSCGAPLTSCIFWSDIIEGLSMDTEDLQRAYAISAKLESHLRIPAYLFRTRRHRGYDELQAQVFAQACTKTTGAHLLDSSKFIARYLQLRRNGKLRLKGIYMVRDIRGVIHSFGKQVQTPKGPYATLLYHTLINFFGQLVYWTDKRVIKIRYEDLVSKPEATLSEIAEHVFGNAGTFDILPDSFPVPHIIGGNRMKAQQAVRIKSDDAWKEKLSRPRQVLYYILALPYMALNRYKI